VLNYYFGSRSWVNADPSAVARLYARLKPLSVALVVLRADGRTHELALLRTLEAWNPPTDPYVHGRQLVGDGRYEDTPAGVFLPSHGFDLHERRAAVREAVDEAGRELGVDFGALVAPGALFLFWGEIDWGTSPPRMRASASAERYIWSLVVGFSTMRASVLQQRKVQDGLRDAGFVTADFGGYCTVFGRRVAVLRAGEVDRVVDLAPQLSGIADAMRAFLEGPGKKVAPPDIAIDGVEAFLCYEERLADATEHDGAAPDAMSNDAAAAWEPAATLIYGARVVGATDEDLTASEARACQKAIEQDDANNASPWAVVRQGASAVCAPTFLGVEVAAARSEIMAEGGMPDGDDLLLTGVSVEVAHVAAAKKLGAARRAAITSSLAELGLRWGASAGLWLVAGGDGTWASLQMASTVVRVSFEGEPKRLRAITAPATLRCWTEDGT
jgi:hypothetical protein